MLPAEIAWAAVLSGLLATAVAHDVRARRIPNAVVAATLGAGLVHAAAAGPALAPAVGAALLGALLGLAAWLPLYALGMLGAGDVKLFAAAAAWLGPAAIWPASLYSALAGAVLAAAWLIQGRLARTRPTRVTSAARDRRLPYGVAVAAGVLAVVWGVA
jgi:prepilin peptidase CpaA